MKKYNNKPNATGSLIEAARINKGYSKEEVCRKLQLLGINIDRTELYRIENSQMIIKDFELVGFCKVLDIDYNELINIVE